MHVIIKEGLYDKEFVEKWTHGFDKLARSGSRSILRKRSRRSPGSPKKKSSRRPGSSPTSQPASVQWGVPVDLAAEGAVVCNSVIHLWTITGNIDIPGGMAIARMALDVPPYPMSQEAIDEYYGDVMSPEQMAQTDRHG